jgi:hypothetical protein
MEKSDGLEYLESEPGGNKACGSPSFWVKSSQNDLEMAAAQIQRTIHTTHRWGGYTSNTLL